MARYYHIHHDKDCFDDLDMGQTIELIQPFAGPTAPPAEEITYWQELERNVNQMFPTGVSFWGQLFYLGLFDNAVGAREAVCENVHTNEYSHRLSRLQSFFCSESLSDARELRELFEVPNADIWEIEHLGSQIERLDMEWIRGVPFDEFDDRREAVEGQMRSYWAGDETKSPRFEILLMPPIRVLGCIDSPTS